MSKFGRCKECRSDNPPSGWQTATKSLCVNCAVNRRIEQLRKQAEIRQAKRNALMGIFK